jgi:hypothetical protein
MHPDVVGDDNGFVVFQTPNRPSMGKDAFVFGEIERIDLLGANGGFDFGIVFLATCLRT